MTRARALIKKQLAEVFAWLYRDMKKGTRRTGAALVLYGVLYAVMYTALGAMFYGMGMMLSPMIEAGYAWLYMALTGIVGVVMGVFGGVFNTYTTLYNAKDNELILSLPIPPRLILISRLIGVYAIGLLYELTVMIPTNTVYLIHAKPGVLGVIFTLIIPIVLSFIVLVLCCILGWLVALIASRLKGKSYITVILSLAFIVAYYAFYSRVITAIKAIVENPGPVSEGVKIWAWPFRHMGLAAEGNALSMLIFTGTAVLLFAAVYLVLSRSFISIITTKRGEKKVVYSRGEAKTASPDSALLRREFKRFTSSPTYMLNCGLGIIMMPAAAAAMLIFNSNIREVLSLFAAEHKSAIPLVAAAVICFAATMNNITSPSISLEGKYFWIIQSLPLSLARVLFAKLKMHLILTYIPAIPLAAALIWLISPYMSSPLDALIVLLPSALFILFMALAGLCLNIRFHNFEWSSEAVPVKRSLSVTLSVFGGWLVVAGLTALYVLAGRFLPALAYAAIAAVIIGAAAAIMLRYVASVESLD